VKPRFLKFLLAVVAVLLAMNVVSQAQTQSLLTRHTREVTLNGEAKLTGHLPATQTLRFDIVLALRHQPELENFLQELYDPSSPHYRHFLTSPEFTERFGPSQEDYDALIHFAQASEFTVVGGSREAMDVQLKGTVAVIERAFHVTLNTYQHPTENRTFFAPDREPMVDLPFQLWHITGLDNYSIPRPAFAHRNANTQAHANVNGSCPNNSYCGSDMRAAYYGASALTGAGQTLGLLEYAGYDIVDIDTYFKNVGQTNNVPIVGISTDGTPLSCTAPGCDDTEQTIDMQQAISMAPALADLYVFVGSSDTALLGGMSSASPLSSQLSSSWTWSPSDPSTDDPYFQKMASQGQSYYQAAGDSGAYTNESEDVWPADSAYVTTVGGTDLVTKSPGGPWSSETAWVDGGGGYFTPDHIAIPAWQQLSGVINAANEGSTTLRNSPDVSAEANFDFYYCSDQDGCGTGLGGTSFAAPMWAGFTALINQQATAGGNPVVGFINPAVYELGVGSGYGAAFHDITSGSNGYPAVTGYDLATGWGSPNGVGLINALAGTAAPGFTISLSPNALTINQGASGASTVNISDQGGFTGSVTFTTSGLPTGVTASFSPNPGTSTSTLTLKASSTAALGVASVTVTGTSGSIAQNITLTLTITGPNFSLTASPTSVTIAPGSSGTSTISVVPTNGFTGSVTLAASGLPAGITAAFSVNPTTSTSVVTFTVGTSAATGAHAITIAGTSGSLSSSTKVTVIVKGAKVKLSPTSLTFSKIKVGATSSAKTVTLTNSGNQTLDISTITISGDFLQKVVTGSCVNGTAVAAGKTCTLKIQFKPTETGTRTGAVTINDNAQGSPQTVPLTGTGG
jgi:subtilase family serine protease